MKPFLKWVGGKTQILDSVLSCFPDYIHGDYYEPFLGGGSVLLGVLSKLENDSLKIDGNIYACDKNENLINLYQVVKDDVESLIREMEILCGVYVTANKSEDQEVNRNPQNIEEALTSQESAYYWYRKMYNRKSTETPNKIKKAALFLFLNKTCFRGMYREGPNGFNVPFGNYKTPGIYDTEHLCKISHLFKKYDVNFACSSFEESLKELKQYSFVYFDPPYAPETDKSFVGYVAGGFSKEQHQQLFAKCNQLVTNVDNHIRIVMSNANVEMVKKAFDESLFQTTVLECRRAINSKKPNSTTTEVLISSK
jgi:DNA adenine methylase